MTTHTSGPWKLNRDHTVSIPYRGPHCCASAYGGTEANARLIASAPDLLAALEEAVSEVESLRGFVNSHGGMIDDENCDYGRAAIARAKGE